MSKRAEEAALKVYPYDGGTKGWICKSSRPIFIKGYEQAEKETIERAVKWLEENVWESTGLDFQILTESFKSAMK